MVRIVQLLCPSRHCLLAAPYEDDRSSFDEAKGMLKAMISQGPFNAWCALCGSHELHYEDGPTRFKNLQEAAPFIGATAADNALTRAALDAAGLTHDKRRLN